MKTFKEFLSEIDHDDTAIGSDQSHGATRRITVDKNWKKLLRLDTGEQVVYRKYESEHLFSVALVDSDNSAAVFMHLERKTVKIGSRTLIGVQTGSLTSRLDFRGKGLPGKIYQALVDHGQVLFSDNTQTTGSRYLWEKLVANNQAFVLATDSAARWYARKYDTHVDGANVLLTGSLERLNDEAYATTETRWVVVPKDLPGLDVLKQEAIHLD